MASLLTGYSFIAWTGPNLTLSTAPWKNKVDGVYEFNSLRTSFISFKPSNGYPAVTQLVKGKMYVFKVNTAFDLADAVLAVIAMPPVVVVPVPTITSFTPTSGAAGSSVVIVGTNFAGATLVSINSGAVANFVVNGPTQITAVLSNAQTTGRPRVTTPGGTAVSVADFMVTVPNSSTYAVNAEGDSLTADERMRTTPAYPGNSYKGFAWSWFKQWQTGNTDATLLGFNNYATSGDIVNELGMLSVEEKSDVLAGYNNAATQNWLFLLTGINNIQTLAGPNGQTDGIAIGEAAYEKVRQLHVQYNGTGNYKTIAYCLTYSRASVFSPGVQAVLRTAVDRFNALMREGYAIECKAALLLDLPSDDVLGLWDNVTVGTQSSPAYVDALHYSEPGAARLRNFAVFGTSYLKAGTVGIISYNTGTGALVFTPGNGISATTTLVAQTPAVLTQETSVSIQCDPVFWPLTQGVFFHGNQGRVCTTVGKRIKIRWRGTSLEFGTPRAGALGTALITTDGEVDGNFSQNAKTTENSAVRYKTGIYPQGEHITYFEIDPKHAGNIWFDTVTAYQGETVPELGNDHPGFLTYYDAAYAGNTNQKWFDKSDNRKHALQLTSGSQMALERDYFGPGLAAYTRPNDIGNFVIPELAGIRAAAGQAAEGEYTIYALLRSDEDTWFFERLNIPLDVRQLLTVNSSLGCYYDSNEQGRGGAVNASGAPTLIVYKLSATPGEAKILRNGLVVWSGNYTPFALDGTIQLGSAGEDNAERALGIVGGISVFGIYNGVQSDTAIRAKSIAIAAPFGITIP